MVVLVQIVGNCTPAGDTVRGLRSEEFLLVDIFASCRTQPLHACARYERDYVVERNPRRFTLPVWVGRFPPQGEAGGRALRGAYLQRTFGAPSAHIRRTFGAPKASAAELRCTALRNTAPRSTGQHCTAHQYPPWSTVLPFPGQQCPALPEYTGIRRAWGGIRWNTAGLEWNTLKYGGIGIEYAGIRRAWCGIRWNTAGLGWNTLEYSGIGVEYAGIR
eukprot:gene23363-biopygen19329